MHGTLETTGTEGSDGGRGRGPMKEAEKEDSDGGGRA